MIIGHGGNILEAAKKAGCSTHQIIDMSSNTNPLGPLPGLMDHLLENLDSVTNLPEADARTAIGAFARFTGLNEGNILAGNGTTQFIYYIHMAVKPKKAQILGPTY